MTLIDASELPELPDLAGEDQQDQIRRELYSQILKDLSENQMDLATNYSVLNIEQFPTPMDWIINQATKALNAFDEQFAPTPTPEPLEIGDKRP